MTMLHSSQINRADVQLDALRAEFGAILADRMLQSELADFLWVARLQAHYLGQQPRSDELGDEEPEELSRVAILSDLDRRWHVALCLVDGEGDLAGMAWHLCFDTQRDAEFAYGRAR